MSQDDDKTAREPGTDRDSEETYERPQVTDYGILTELTLSGHGIGNDGLITQAS